MKPTIVPEWTTENNISSKVGPFKLMQQGINCPDGTVIVKRTTMQDLINAQRLKSTGFIGPRHFLTGKNSTNSNGKPYFATVDYGPSSFSGVKGVLNLWKPQVSQDQFSLAYMAIGGGAGGTFASISVGWMVNPSLYQDNNAHLYASWIAHGGQVGCYDVRCPGFVQVSKMIPLGALLQPVSVYKGKQCELQLSLYEDRAKGDWWFSYGNENIGYWPASLFMASNLANRPSYASWGGQAFSPETEKTPVMGSGHWPRERLNKAAYVNSIKILNGKGNVVDPESDIMKTRSTNPKCYRVIYVHEDSEPWLNAVYFGGPGGCIGK